MLLARKECTGATHAFRLRQKVTSNSESWAFTVVQKYLTMLIGTCICFCLLVPATMIVAVSVLVISSYMVCKKFLAYTRFCLLFISVHIEQNLDNKTTSRPDEKSDLKF